MPEYAIEITVKEKTQIFPVHLLYLDVVQGRQGNNLILVDLHRNMVYLDHHRTALHPYQFVQTFIALQRFVLVKIKGHRDITVHPGIKTIFHNKPVFVPNIRDKGIPWTKRRHKIKKKVAGEVCPWIKRVVLKYE
jgi:hypothetical protein